MKKHLPSPPKASAEDSHDQRWMALALSLARKAASQAEVPVGAVLVRNGTLVAQAANVRESAQTPIGHAEILCLHRGAKKLQNWRLIDCTLYVTLEPCPMCAGALVASRVRRLVYAASDPKGGAAESLYQITQDPRLNHQLLVTGGVMQDESAALLKEFFRQRRAQSKKLRQQRHNS